VDISQLMEFDRIAREDGENYPRERCLLQQIIEAEGEHFVGIAGPRGAGKTVILKQFSLRVENSFYISLDTVEGNLFEIVRELNRRMEIETFLLDEIHFNDKYEESLKKIYDFLDVNIIFTSSVSLSLYKSSYDLSRRILIKKLYPFSFREYLYFKYDEQFATLTLEDIIEKQWNKKIFSYAQIFNDYLKGGNLPFSLEEPDPLLLLDNIVNTVIRRDIPSLGRIAVEEIDLLKQMLKFIGKAEVDGINYSSLSRNLGITKYKAKQYVDFFEKAFILMKVMPRGTNVLKEPKILMALPYRLLYRDFKGAIGPLREDFFVEMMLSAGKKIDYLKSTRGAKTPDYMLSSKKDEMIVEVGGKSKGREQFKGIKGSKKLIFSHSTETESIKRPLFLAGFVS
jgi:hypothetical protein